jgi:hypothetical protein
MENTMNAKLMNQDQVETMLNHKAPEAMGEAINTRFVKVWRI